MYAYRFDIFMLSDDENFLFFADAPSAPLDLTRSKTSKSSITISWAVPKDKGSYPIIAYLVETESPSGFRAGVNYTKLDKTGSSKKYEHTFASLKEDLRYKIFVSAYNLAGRGDEATQIFETVSSSKQGW